MRELEVVKDMTPAERAQAQAAVAIGDPKHLQKWLEATGRKWLVFNALDLVEALPWPEGVDDLLRVVTCYREYRQTVPTGGVEVVEDSKGKVVGEAPTFKGEVLEFEELDRCIRHLISLITEKDPTWALENAPL